MILAALLIMAQFAQQPNILRDVLLKSAPYPVYGAANFSCSRWNTEKLDGSLRVGQAGYISGFVTALNMASRSNQTGAMDAAAALAWMDRYCARLPEEPVADGLDMLAADIQAAAIRDGRIPNWGL